jgi:hypothetical protein
MIGSDQAPRSEGLDDVRAYGVRCRVLPFDPPPVLGPLLSTARTESKWSGRTPWGDRRRDWMQANQVRHRPVTSRK